MSKLPKVSVIIPARDSENTIGDCLHAVFRSDYHPFEVVLVNDGSLDRTREVAGRFPCTVIHLDASLGAAGARNRGAAVARGEILFFLDADIVIESDTISRVVQAFHSEPGISALFGSYQKDTVPAGFYTVYKNLVHHYTHQASRNEAVTFWSGCGAIRRSVFCQSGGFDEGYRYLEDIELGYRLHQAGHRILMHKGIQVTHLKRYSLPGLIRSDVLGRAKPWTEIMLDKRVFRTDLNTRVENILSVIVSYLLLAALPLVAGWPDAWPVLPALSFLFLVLNHEFLALVLRETGPYFTAKAILMHWFAYLYSGFGLVLGLVSHLRKACFRRRTKDE